MMDLSRRVAVFLAVPWSAFVAAFLYYTLLALLALGGALPSDAVVATAYLAPVVAYLITLTTRLHFPGAHS